VCNGCNLMFSSRDFFLCVLWLRRGCQESLLPLLLSFFSIAHQRVVVRVAVCRGWLQKLCFYFVSVFCLVCVPFSALGEDKTGMNAPSVCGLSDLRGRCRSTLLCLTDRLSLRGYFPLKLW